MSMISIFTQGTMARLGGHVRALYLDQMQVQHLFVGTAVVLVYKVHVQPVVTFNLLPHSEVLQHCAPSL